MLQHSNSTGIPTRASGVRGALGVFVAYWHRLDQAGRFILALIVSVPTGACSASEHKNVLIINSYHIGYWWTDGLMNGLLEGLAKNHPDARISVEYMDWKNFPSPENLDNFTHLARNKYPEKHLDVVITTDNAAFDFATRHRVDIFRNAPVVFSGVNGFQPAMLRDQSGITGITEDVDAARTLRAAFDFHPDTRKVLVISGATESGQAVKALIVAASRQFSERSEFVYLDNPSFQEAVDAASALKPGEIILAGGINRDRDGRAFDAGMIAGRTRVPVYALWDQMLGGGIVGGSLLSGRQQGLEAASLAAAILDGQPAPPILQGVTHYMFDVSVLNRFKVPPERIPHEARLVNAPPARDPTWLYTVLATALLLVLLTTLAAVRFARLSKRLRVTVSERTAAQKDLQASETRFRALFTHMNTGFALHEIVRDAEGKIVDYRFIEANQAFEHMLGIHQQHLAGRCISETLPAIKDLWMKNYAAAASSGKPQRKENYCQELGRWFAMHVYRSEPERFATLLEDISERRLAETQLRIAAIAFDAQEGMLVTDARCIILKANRAFSEISGYSTDEAVGQKVSLLQSGRHDTAFYQGMWEKILHTGSWQGELWNWRKNGELYPEWLTITAVKDRDGEITHYVSTHTDITERKTAEERIRHLAFHDQLTQLPNRQLLLERARKALLTSARTEEFGAIFFIDLDNFKTLNDTCGHDQGDLLLQQVARRLSACIRECDTVARLGGDEFVVILEGLSTQESPAREQAGIVGQKMLASLNEPYTLSRHEHRSTPSMGCVLFNNKEQTVDELLRHADASMYRAKSAGRNTLHFFDPNAKTPPEPFG